MKFTNIGKEDGLSSSFVTCIEQDSIGYIWIGTKNGLNKYSGVQNEIFQKKSGDTTSLLSNLINCLHLDTKGKLWIGTNAGLLFYNKTYNSFRRFVFENRNKGIDLVNITWIDQSADGKLLCASGQSIYQLENNNFIRIIKIERGYVSCFITDSEDNIWVGTENDGGLHFWERKQDYLHSFYHDPEDKNSIGSNSPVEIALDDNILWIATIGDGINSYHIKNKKFKHYPVSFEYEKQCLTAYIDKEKNVFIGDVTGLKRYDKEKDAFYAYYPDEQDPYALKGGVNCIYMDKQENYWIGQQNKGLGLDIKNKGFTVFSKNIDATWNTTNNNITCIAEDKNGNLWIGNGNNGIDIFKWEEHKTQSFIHHPNDPESLGKGSIFSIMKDHEEVMWVGSYSGGLQYFDDKHKHFISFTHQPDDTNSLAKNDIRSVIEDRNGDIWCAVHGKGIDRYDRAEQIFCHYNSKNNHLSNDWTYQVLEDHKGDIWVATAWGLNRLKKGTHQFINYYSQDGIKTSLSNNEVISLYEDSKERLWIGTINGLQYYNEKKDHFTRQEGELEDKHICGILEDKKGNIWISTLSGIYQIDQEHNIKYNFKKKDGISSNEFNDRAYFKNDNHELFFGGINGLTVFKPENLNFNLTPPEVEITAFKLFYKPVEVNKEGPLYEHISMTRKIELDHAENTFSFEFIALNHIHPEENLYVYKLEGFDKKWINAGHKREAYYTNISPGNYVFRVIAANNDRVWNKKGASVQIIIKPPWWKTWWFRITSVIMLMSAIIGFVAIRTRQIRKNKLRLEKEVRQRTQELREKNSLLRKNADELNEINTQLEEKQQKVEEQSEELRTQAEKLEKVNETLNNLVKTKDKFFSIIAHDLKNPFNSILGFSDVLHDNYYEMSEEERMESVKILNESSYKVFELLINLLDWSRIQTGNIQFIPEKINLLNQIEQIEELYHEQLTRKDLRIIKNVERDILVHGDLQMVKTILRNIINNAIKYSVAKTNIVINAELTRNAYQIEIKDGGIGMDSVQLEHLFNLDKTSTAKGTAGEEGTGLGLILVKEFVEKNGGNIWVKSKPHEGSSFFFTLPVAKNHI